MIPNPKDTFVTRCWFLVLPLVIFVVLLGANHAGAQFQEVAFSVTDEDRKNVYDILDKPASPSACPASAAGLPDVIERDDFCVYYEEAETSNYAGGVLSVEDAELAADIVQDYWDRYDLALGFLTPKHTDKLVVDIQGVNDCNGGTGSTVNYMYVYTGCFVNPESIQKVIGHELFHRVQYSYHGTEVKWFKEGTARAMEDNAFDNIDNWATALTAISSSFNKQVNTYLNSTNNDITSNAMRYNSALWWKYFTEQYGNTPTEPELGVNAFVALWEAAVSLDDIAALNSALGTLGAGTDFENAFKQFAVANYTKDLTGVPDDSYNYEDEEQVGNPAVYGPVDMVNGGPLDPGDTGGWTNQLIKRYGIKYYQMTVGPTCQAVSVSFHRDSADIVDVFYHIVTQKAGVFDAHREGTGTDWGQSFLNDGITAVAAIVGGLDNDVQVDLNFACVVPELEIKIPNSTAVAFVGPYNVPGKFLAQILVTDGTEPFPVVAGLTNEDFQASVNGEVAPVDGGGFIQEQYWLVIDAPDQLSNGTYDLEVSLEAPGSGIVIASDTSPDSLVYDEDLGDHVIVIDRSYSMNDDEKLVAAQDAASFYVDATLDGDGLAVVPFKEDVVDVFNMEAVDTDVRVKAKEFIDLLTPSGSTSIGDGLYEAVSQRASTPTGNPRCGFTLLSDGMENASLYWTDVMTEVVNTGCPVTTIAFGPESDETLMQEIATATGGDYFYNDVYVSSSPTLVAAAATSYDDTALELGGYYEYAQGRSEQRERLLAERGVSPTETDVYNWHYVTVDETVSEVVFSLDWARPKSYLRMDLVDPNGNKSKLPELLYDDENGHVVFRIKEPDPGEWTILVYILEQTGEGVPYQVVVSAHTKLSLTLFLPDKYGRVFFTGQAVPIYAVVAYRGPLTGVQVDAYVTAPDGVEGHVHLFDDGEHGDGITNDGLYAGVYTRVNRSSNPPPPPEEGQIPEKFQAGYRVKVVAATDRFRREALGSFAIMRGIDKDGDSLPDIYEEIYGVDDPKVDPDLDELFTSEEYELGTHPLNPDTDGGGEGDGSEYQYQQDPLDPSDDNSIPPAFFHTSPLNGAVRLFFDYEPMYENVGIWRKLGVNGEWGVISGTVTTGVYSDTGVTNNATYYYGILPMTFLSGPVVFGETTAAELHYGGMVVSDGVTPMEDPFPPEARMLINNGAPVTHDLDVILSFTRYEEEGVGPETFDDIAWVKLSNTPSFKGVSWQPFSDVMPWALADIPPGEIAYVYARFKDQAENESVGTEVASILYDWWYVQLPLVMKQD